MCPIGQLVAGAMKTLAEAAADGSSGTTLCRSRRMDRFEKVLNLANPASVSVDDIRRH
jgi:hypothetical protein